MEMWNAGDNVVYVRMDGYGRTDGRTYDEANGNRLQCTNADPNPVSSAEWQATMEDELAFLRIVRKPCVNEFLAGKRGRVIDDDGF